MSARSTFRRPRRRREKQRPWIVLAGAGVTVALFAVFAITMVRAPRTIPILAYKTVYASLPETGNLRVHAEVRANGVQVGEVVDVESAGSRARVRVKLDPGVLEELPSDTKASVRGKGLLGARSVFLEPGTSNVALAEGATMQPARNPITLSVTDALDALDRRTRGGLGTTVGELGRGMLGNGGKLNDAVRVAAPTGKRFNEVVDAILVRPGAAQRLAPSLDSAVAALNRGVDDIAAGIGDGERSLRPLVDRRADTQALLREAPPTFDAATPAFADGRRLLAAVGALARAARGTLPRAGGGLRSTARLLGDGRAPLARAGALVDDLRPAIRPTRRLVHRAAPLLDPARRLLSDALPLVKLLGAHGCDIVDFGDNWRSTLNQGTRGGSLIGPLTAFRVTVLGSAETVSGFGKLDPSGIDRDGYPPPCKFSVPPRAYPVLSPTAGRAR